MFYIEKDDNNQYVFHLKSDKKHTIATSKPFKKIEEVKKTIGYIAENTNLDRIYERKTNKQGQFYFNILNTNLQTTAESQCYNSKAGLENGIKAAKEFAKLHKIKTKY